MQELLSIPVAFRDATRLPPDIDPVAVNRELAALYIDRGDLRTPDIVDAARDPASAMHSAIEWNDDVAAERHREGQALYLAGSLIDQRTHQRVYVSRYAETNDPKDARRMRINVRLLPQSDAAPAHEPVRIPIRPALRPTPIIVEAAEPTQAVVEYTPDEEQAIAKLRRWVEAYRYEPAVLRAALRLLHEYL